MESMWKDRMLLIALHLAFYQAQTTAFTVTAPYSLYVCPTGQNVTLICKLSGPLPDDSHDFFYKRWYFSSHGDQSCSQSRHIRNVTEKELHHPQTKHHVTHNTTMDKNFYREQADHHGVEISTDHHGTFRMSLRNLTLQDSGIYCCYVLGVPREHHGKPRAEHTAHGFMELRIQKAMGALVNCTYHPADGKGNENITAAALATGACIVGILCLPLILLLIYKQRQAVSHRRAQELVRMESNAQGIENPVFESVPSVNNELKPRPQLTYVSNRQQ
uniref:V-set immunoregulatory receptor n=1 Tax=Sphenodon punctatus TaxID=8508 RepID=A0A8D0HM61_SPHPU